MQIRDLKTRKPLPGVDVGEMGPKYGFTTNPNGFIRFSNFRVPKDSLLCRYLEISKDGLKKRGNEKI